MAAITAADREVNLIARTEVIGTDAFQPAIPDFSLLLMALCDRDVGQPALVLPAEAVKKCDPLLGRNFDIAGLLLAARLSPCVSCAPSTCPPS